MYDVIKTLHIVSVIIWMGGMILAAAQIPLQSGPGLRGLVRRLLTPMMLVAWALGLYLAISGDWFSHGWLHAKLGVVILLSGLHGMLIGQLRKADAAGHVPSAMAHALPWMVVAGTVIAVGLVELQPF